VINKQLSTPAQVALRLTNFLAGSTAQVWQLTAANAISRLSDVSVVANTLSNTVPAQSITLLVVPLGAAPPRLRAGPVSATNTLPLSLEGLSGQRYVLQSTTDFRSWAPVVTNTLSSNSWQFTLPVTNLPAQFYRAQWAP
jgi:hypothetical protein